MKLSGHKAMSYLTYQHLNDLISDISNFNYVIVKGEILSKLCYNSFGERLSSDIDILAPRDEIKKIECVLRKHGFVSRQIRADRLMMLAYSHQVAPWSKSIPPCGYALIDLNFDLFWGEYTGERINIGEFISDNTEMDVYGVKVKTLSPLKAIIQLIMHHYKEMNSIYHLAGHNSIKFNMFKDVFFLWKNNQEVISLEKLHNICSEYDIVPFAFYMLYFTNQIFNDLELEKYVLAFKTEEGINLLDYYGLAEKERKPWKVDFKTRLETENLYDLIKDELTEDDFEKLKRNRRIFG